MSRRIVRFPTAGGNAYVDIERICGWADEWEGHTFTSVYLDNGQTIAVQMRADDVLRILRDASAQEARAAAVATPPAAVPEPQPHAGAPNGEPLSPEALDAVAQAEITEIMRGGR